MRPNTIDKMDQGRVQVFRRWSRKGFAAFSSMHKQVIISCLDAHYNLLDQPNNFFLFAKTEKRNSEGEMEFYCISAIASPKRSNTTFLPHEQEEDYLHSLKN